MPNTVCPCGSQKLFNACCGRFLEQEQFAKTPEQLMRSRFTAFFMGGYGQYLEDTWAAEMRGGLRAVDLNQRETEWLRLEIIKKNQKGDSGEVEFKAYFKDGNAEGCHHEHSCFERRDGRWLYISAK